jgi:hypothetical protein
LRYAATNDDALLQVHVVDASAIRECAALKLPHYSSEGFRNRSWGFVARRKSVEVRCMRDIGRAWHSAAMKRAAVAAFKNEGRTPMRSADAMCWRRGDVRAHAQRRTTKDDALLQVHAVDGSAIEECAALQLPHHCPSPSACVRNAMSG